jgi:proteasome lid subunit RPN8/RPN11
VTPPYPLAVLEVAFAHCEQAYPLEGCGLILRGEDGALEAVPMKNAIDRYHARDPVRFPRTAATAYLFDPREQMQVMDDAERLHKRAHCIFHSHVDRGAYFSDEDVRMAAPGGIPLHDGLEYVVISVVSGKVKDAALFRWDGAGFVQQSLDLPTR